MKIMSITMVKNESDIIESFIRYTLNIVDEMIILDNGSTDETINIINKLIDENLPIILYKDDDKEYEQSIKTTQLLNIAMTKFDADLVCILDVDEFIISNIDQHPREILEKLDLIYYYYINMIHYIPTDNDDINIKFIPKRITHTTQPVEVYKVIVPKNIFNNYDFDVAMGNHDLSFKQKNGSKLGKKEFNLSIAHYPIRSKEQCFSKFLVGWPNIVATKTLNTNAGIHWKRFFDKIRNDHDISFDEIATIYNPDNLTIKNQPINLDLFNNLEIRYASNYSYLNNVLDSYIFFANEVALLKRQLNVKNDEIKLIDVMKIKLKELILFR